MLARALDLLSHIEVQHIARDSAAASIVLTELMKNMHSFRPSDISEDSPYPLPDSTEGPILKSYIQSIRDMTFLSSQGTTHISVIDSAGNAASMTTSNGSGSGCYIPGTGIMLNNMMGEDDLHPGGFFSAPPGRRVSSMMIPSIVIRDNAVECVLGSGGSKRIRSAILQVLVNIIDYSMSLKDAVEFPRIHMEDGTLQTEPGLPEQTLAELQSHYALNTWDVKNMYFGGVHCADCRMDARGDSRRGGSCIAVQ